MTGHMVSKTVGDNGNMKQKDKTTTDNTGCGVIGDSVLFFNILFT